MTRAGFFGRNIVASGLASVGAALLLVATDAPSAVANAQYGRSDIISGTVMTDKGPVDGTLLSSGASFVFKGIPYAAPPTGDLRWRPPEPRNPWTAWTEVSIPADGVAGKYTICPQAAPNPAFNFAVSEDCLRLNVWAPVYSDHPLPVIFWLHGGGHTAGSGIRARGFFSDGQYFAERVDDPVIVVTVEFRLGALGFLAHPSLDAENGGTSGNYGLLDQVAALNWVRTNIAAFGGDPSNVTVTGFSAGATDACIHLASPLSRGLFARTIMESGNCGPFPSLADAEAIYDQNIIQPVRADPRNPCSSEPDVIACLRTRPWLEIFNISPPSPDFFAPTGGLEIGGEHVYGPNYDGYLLTGPPFDIIKKNAHHHVPLVIGNNSDETGLQVSPGLINEAAPAGNCLPNAPIAPCTYANKVHLIYGTDVGDQLLANYPASNFVATTNPPRSAEENAFIRLTTDGFFVCPSRRVARNFDTKKEPVYRYTHSHAFGGTGTHVAGASGAYHSSEIVFVFHTVDRIANPTLVTYKPTVGEGLLADQMNNYWAHFATSSNPNFFEAPVWPIYDASDTYLDLNADAWSTTTRSDTAFRNEDCDVWDALFPVHPHPMSDDDGRQR